MWREEHVWDVSVLQPCSSEETGLITEGRELRELFVVVLLPSCIIRNFNGPSYIPLATRFATEKLRDMHLFKKIYRFII
jgi:hypothetical protein